MHVSFNSGSLFDDVLLELFHLLWRKPLRATHCQHPLPKQTQEEDSSTGIHKSASGVPAHALASVKRSQADRNLRMSVQSASHLAVVVDGLNLLHSLLPLSCYNRAHGGDMVHHNLVPVLAQLSTDGSPRLRC